MGGWFSLQQRFEVRHFIPKEVAYFTNLSEHFPESLAELFCTCATCLQQSLLCFRNLTEVSEIKLYKPSLLCIFQNGRFGVILRLHLVCFQVCQFFLRGLVFRLF